MLGLIVACLLVAFIAAAALASWHWRLKKRSVELAALQALLEQQMADRALDDSYQARGYEAMTMIGKVLDAVQRIEGRLGHVLGERRG